MYLCTPNLPTNIVHFRGFDPNTILVLRGEIRRPIGDLPESLTQAMLVGIMLVGRLGVVVQTYVVHRGTRLVVYIKHMLFFGVHAWYTYYTQTCFTAWSFNGHVYKQAAVCTL